MTDSDLAHRIRAIFLHDEPSVSIETATSLLGWSRAEMLQAIATIEIEARLGCSGRVVAIEEVVAKALELWPLEEIEDALGRHAALVLPPELRTQSLCVRLPRYQVAMLRLLAEQRRTTVGHVIARQLGYLADEHMHELSSAIPGFSDAFRWPDVDEGSKPC